MRDGPPAIARLLLRLLLPRRDRAELLSDLDAEYVQRLAADRAAARRWYRRQVASSVWPLFVLHREPGRHTAHTHRTSHLMVGLRQDVRGALRQMRRRPLAHVAIALTLALGIGANAAIFSVVKAVLLEPLPYPQAERLVRVWNHHEERGLNRISASLQDVRDWREGAPSIAGIAAWNAREGNLSGEGSAERIDYALVTPDFFRALGVSPILGRDFTEADNVPGSDAVVVVSHGFWQERFGRDPSAIGRTVRVDDVAMTIVGVMPAGFAFPQRGTVLWKPFGMGPDDAGPRIGRWVSVVARLANGATVAQAEGELVRIAAHNAQAFPRSNEGWSTRLEPLSSAITRDVRGTLWIVWATIGLVLLIAAANVTNLLLARAVERRQEFAVRAALGAGRARLARQVLVESVILSLAGAALGVMVAPAALAVLARFGETSLAGGAPPRIDGGVLLFTFGTALVTGLLIGVIPAARSGRASVARAGRAVIGQSGRLRGALVTAEVALALTTLIGAGLLLRSLAFVQDVDIGLEAEHRLTLRIAPASSALSRAGATELWRRIEESVASVPGIEAVGAVNRLPLEGHWWTSHIAVRGMSPADGPAPSVLHRVITPGYFDAAGIRLLRGRLPSAQDDAGSAGVMAISAAAARSIWGDADPLGAVVTNEDPQNPNAHWYTVVGVVSDVRYGAPEDAVTPASYTTLAQASWGHFGDWGMGLIVATRADPVASIAAVRAAVARIAPELPVHDVRTMQSRIDDASSARLSVTRSIGAFALLAVIIAIIGTYAVMTSSLARQVPEIGLRIALGASASSIAAMILARGLRPAIAGVFLGLAGGEVAGRLLQSMLFGISPRDPLTFAGTAALLLVLALTAALAPAWRASRLSPREALASD